MKRPGDLHQKSSRIYRGLPDITYPGFDRTLLISSCGRICFNRLKINLSRALSNQPVGIKEVDNGIWRVDFMSYTLGYFDEESRKFSPNDDPFGLRFNAGIV